MREIYKNPTLYYILVPLVIALWPLLVWAVYLPRAEHHWDADHSEYDKAQKVIAEILELDPERLESRDVKTGSEKFDYTPAVAEVAGLCQIPSSNYELSSKPARTSGGQKTQSCHLVLREVDIARFAKFLYTIQLQWPSLRCEKLTLAKKKGLPDTWKVDLDFKYYF
jgi:hypothetical protein